MIRILTVLLLAAALSSCQQTPEQQQPRKLVVIAEAVTKDVPLYIEAVGNVLPLCTIEVRAQVTGQLLAAHVAEGQYVQQGDLLYTIDPAPYQARLEEAEATACKDEAALALALDKVKRYSSLANEDYISTLAFDELKTDVKLKMAQVAIDRAVVVKAEVDLGYCRICSPIDGRLSYNTFDVGNLIVANDNKPMTTVRQITPIQITFAIAQKDFIRLQEQQEEHAVVCDFLVQRAGNEEPLKRSGTLTFIDNVVNPDNGTVVVRGVIPNEDTVLWPGEFGRARLHLKTLKNSVVISEKALQQGQRGPYLFVYNDDATVSVRYVVVGDGCDGEVVIVDGITSGEQVVIEGQGGVREGTAVQIRETT